MAESADFLINRRSRRAFCCEFPAFLLPMAQKQSSGFEFGLAPSFLGASLRYAHPGRRDRSVFGFAYAETGPSSASPTPKQAKSRYLRGFSCLSNFWLLFPANTWILNAAFCSCSGWHPEHKRGARASRYQARDFLCHWYSGNG